MQGRSCRDSLELTLAFRESVPTFCLGVSVRANSTLSAGPDGAKVGCIGAAKAGCIGVSEVGVYIQCRARG